MDSESPGAGSDASVIGGNSRCERWGLGTRSAGIARLGRLGPALARLRAPQCGVRAATGSLRGLRSGVAPISRGYAQLRRGRQRFVRANAALAQGHGRASITVGFAELQPDDTAEGLVARADAELYRARRQQRG
ncbi:MAG: hypothetical protein WKF94_13105 [Solirubrobacteraceae bacterium]